MFKDYMLFSTERVQVVLGLPFGSFHSLGGARSLPSLLVVVFVRICTDNVTKETASPLLS